jgi:hypothetical protein
MSMKDQIVENLIEKYKQRSEVGIKKYGTTLDGNNSDNFLLHALEESMDFSLYLMKIMEIIKTTPNDCELGEKIRDMVRG